MRSRAREKTISSKQKVDTLSVRRHFVYKLNHDEAAILANAPRKRGCDLLYLRHDGADYISRTTYQNITFLATTRSGVTKTFFAAHFAAGQRHNTTKQSAQPRGTWRERFCAH
jgi:hypothetical protein